MKTCEKLNYSRSKERWLPCGKPAACWMKMHRWYACEEHAEAALDSLRRYGPCDEAQVMDWLRETYADGR